MASGLTLCITRLTVPSSPITKVERSTPMYVLAGNVALLGPDAVVLGDRVVVVGEQGERQLVFLLELRRASCSSSGETPSTTAPALLELAIGVADPARLGRAARRVVLGIEVENDLLAAQVGELDGLAAVALSARNRAPACLLRPRWDPLGRFRCRC